MHGHCGPNADGTTFFGLSGPESRSHRRICHPGSGSLPFHRVPIVPRALPVKFHNIILKRKEHKSFSFDIHLLNRRSRTLTKLETHPYKKVSLRNARPLDSPSITCLIGKSACVSSFLGEHTVSFLRLLCQTNRDTFSSGSSLRKRSEELVQYSYRKQQFLEDRVFRILTSLRHFRVLFEGTIPTPELSLRCMKSPRRERIPSLKKLKSSPRMRCRCF